MTGLLYMAWRYLAYHRIKTMILVLSITLIAYLPIGLRVLVGQSAQQLTARAEATPLLVGVKGSPLELHAHGNPHHQRDSRHSSALSFPARVPRDAYADASHRRARGPIALLRTLGPGIHPPR